MYGKFVFKVEHQLSARPNHFLKGRRKGPNEKIRLDNLHH